MAILPQLFLEPVSGGAVFGHDSFIDLDEILMVGRNEATYLFCDFMVYLLLNGGSLGIAGLQAIMFVHDLMGGDHFSAVHLLQYQLADFFQSGLVDVNNLAQNLHLAL